MWNCNYGNILSRNIWWAPENRVCRLGYFITPLTTEGLKISQILSNLGKNQERRDNETRHFN